MAQTKQNIIDKWFAVILYLVPHIETFKKTYKFTIGAKLEAQALDVLSYIIEAYYCSAEQRKQLLPKINILLTQCKYLLRLSFELRLINVKKYEHAAGLMVEVGKMLGGWQKAETNR